ncbi:MAG: hypothetical protein GX492_04860 [Firmicutes bacterium]|nr:hypothetical protein [Bacillota bacterium]
MFDNTGQVFGTVEALELDKNAPAHHRGPQLRPEGTSGENAQRAAKEIFRQVEGDRRIMSKEKIPVT